MKPPPAPLTPSLAERLRAVLAEEGRPPSRRKVAEWIRAGAVTVDGRTLRNPDAAVPAAARISLDLSAASDEEGGLFGASRARGADAAPAAKPVPPAWLLHLDAQLVVVDRAGFPSVAAEELAAAVSRALEAWNGRALALVPVPDPSGAGSGPVLLTASKSGAARLTAAVRAGHVLETLLSLRSPPHAASDEAVLERGDTWVLVQREDSPLRAPPGGAHDLAPPHRAVLVLKHPKTHRRLEFAREPGPAFAAALYALTGAPADDRPAAAVDDGGPARVPRAGPRSPGMRRT